MLVYLGVWYNPLAKEVTRRFSSEQDCLCRGRKCHDVLHLKERNFIWFSVSSLR